MSLRLDSGAYINTIFSHDYRLADFSLQDWMTWEQPTKYYILDKPHWVRLRACVNAAQHDDGYRWAFCYLPLFNPYTIPLAATFILLSSGLTLHIAGMWFRFANVETLWPFNRELREKLFNFGFTQGKMTNTINTPSRSAAYYSITFWLGLTILLGLIFTAIQAYEYIVLLPFAINDSVFGSCFYMLTGFHGFHVILGTIGLAICLYRHMQCHFTKTVHVGFEAASWYWHFVDGVWLFVYSIIYWWSAPLKRPYLWYDDEQEIYSCGNTAASWNTVMESNRVWLPEEQYEELFEFVTEQLLNTTDISALGDLCELHQDMLMAYMDEHISAEDQAKLGDDGLILMANAAAQA